MFATKLVSPTGERMIRERPIDRVGFQNPFMRPAQTQTTQQSPLHPFASLFATLFRPQMQRRASNPTLSNPFLF